MVTFALIPRRQSWIRLASVLGWALVWVDGEWANHWTDSIGLAVTGYCLLLLWLRWNDGRRRPRSASHHGNGR